MCHQRITTERLREAVCQGEAWSLRADDCTGPEEWPRESHRAPREDGVTVVRTAFQNPVAPSTAATVEMLEFPGSDACEWVLKLAQNNHRESPLLTQLYCLDITVELATGAKLYHARGSTAGANDFAPLEEDLSLTDAVRLELSVSGGRSSNGHLPFFNVQTGTDDGFMVAVGWSGQWHAIIETTGDGMLRLRAGMPDVAIALQPGEQIRTPRIAIIPWQGDPIDGHNALRRFLYHYHTPLLAGAIPQPTTWANTWFTFGCGYGVDQANQCESIDGAARLNLEYLTVDAGWYECAHPYWWDGVGSWTPRSEAFPDGFLPLAERGRQGNVGLGIWFEPERAAATSRIAREHPDWLLGPAEAFSGAAQQVNIDHQSFLVNLGLPEVQDWLIRLIDDYVTQGMRWFRHDFNLDPLPVWQAADEPRRQGMTEIRYIEGLYHILDEIHRRHPDLYMEGCASGGRRIDLETVSRNHGYWATDMMCGTPEPMQAHIWGFNHYLLPNWHNTVLQQQNAPMQDTPANRYAFFAFVGGAPCLCFDLRDPSPDAELGRRWVALFKSIRHLTMGDFYPLTDYSLQEDAWMAYQFHRQDLDEGLVLAFRRPRAQAIKATFRLHGLKKGQDYEVTDRFAGSKEVLPATALQSGLTVHLPHQPDVALLHYCQIGGTPQTPRGTSLPASVPGFRQQKHRPSATDRRH